jgi:hypothetical protein
MQNLLSTLLKALGQLLERSPDDSQAAQLECLHAIEQQLRHGAAEHVKACQKDLEKHLMTALLAGPSPPVRHLISSSFCLAFSRGDRQGLYATVGTLLSMMATKGSTNHSPECKVATLEVLGDLSKAHGPAMVQLCHDSIAVLVKTIRAPEVGHAPRSRAPPHPSPACDRQPSVSSDSFLSALD